jgi:hypothetical protein
MRALRRHRAMIGSQISACAAAIPTVSSATNPTVAQALCRCLPVAMVSAAVS